MPFTERSESTRTAIVSTARRLFADRGYQGTTIRAVAAEAGIDPSMVMRYYGNKEGLFAAAVDIDLGLPSAADLPRDRIGEAIAGHVLRRWEGELADELIILLLRSACTNETAAEQLRQVFQRQVLPLVREISGDAPDADRRAALLGTQVIGLAMCRYVLRLPSMVAMDRPTLVASLAPVLRHYLLGDLDRDLDGAPRP
ncbi:MAG TPA: TetR family transcriptional regulator [Pseudonocardia sp.]|jgi:AcrR family transcriptional regulator